ncbi:MAG: hypothetical protein OSJ58_12090, partial [Dysosmobacter sp.]|nr:hypothetical protein [Dysosmobacter sp.]
QYIPAENAARRPQVRRGVRACGVHDRIFTKTNKAAYGNFLHRPLFKSKREMKSQNFCPFYYLCRWFITLVILPILEISRRTEYNNSEFSKCYLNATIGCGNFKSS